MNSAAFGLTDVDDPKVRETIGEIGAQVLIYLSEHPGASDEDISRIGLRAAGLDGPVLDT